MKTRLNQKKHILTTGIQRSGTTFTGSILSLSPEVIYLSEPFNPNYGLEGVDCHFPYVNEEDEQDKYSLLLDDLFSFKASYKKNYSKDNLAKKIAKFVFGTRADITYKLARLKKKNTRFLIKDPDAAFLSEYMSMNYNCDVLVLIRHPGAVMASFKRLGWNFDLEIFLKRKCLMRDQLAEFEHLFRSKNRSMSTQVGLLWVCIYKVLKTFSERNENWLAILHEDLCLHPVETFKNIFEWFGLPFSNRIRQEIIKKTRSGNPVEARNNRLHDMTRDSAQLVNYWKGSISVKERNTLREITEPISSLYYDDNSWQN